MSLAPFVLPAAGPIVKDTWLQEDFLTVYSNVSKQKGNPRQKATNMAKQFAIHCYNKAKDAMGEDVLFEKPVCGSTRPHWMQNECETWNLLSLLMADAAEPNLYNTEQYGQNVPKHWKFGISHKLLVRNLFNRNRILRRLLMILRWLEDSLYDELRYVAEKVQWGRTVQRAKEAKAAFRYDADTSSVADPDARHRNVGLLDPEDCALEDRMLVALFQLVQCGRMREAQELCQQAGQPWRATVLQAQALRHYGALAEPAKDLKIPNSLDDADDTLIQGQESPFLAKELYRRLATNLKLHTHERALCGIMVGHLGAMLAVCGSWRECLWAHIKAVLTYKVDMLLAQCTGEELYTPQWPLPGRPAGMTNDSVLMDDILAEVEQYITARALRTAHPYFSEVQKHIMRLFTANYDLQYPSALDGLLRSIVDPAGDLWPARFACHLVLSLEEVFDSSAENIARARTQSLLRYIGHQQRGEHFARVTYYTALLPADMRTKSFPEFGVQGFPEFMERVQEMDMRPGEQGTARRKQLLESATDANLDLTELIAVAIDNSRKKHQQWLDDPAAVGLSMVMQPVGRILREDWAHIEALQWLTLREGHRLEALLQFTKSIRTFVKEQKFQAAAAIIDLMPKDTISICETLLKEPGRVPNPTPFENGMKEYICWELFLSSIRSAAVWKNHWASKPQRKEPQPQAPSKSQGSIMREVKSQFEDNEWHQCISEWEDKEHRLREMALGQLWNILKFPKGWLSDEKPVAAVPNDGVGSADQRPSELQYLRQICIPHAVALLIDVVKQTGQHDMCLDILAALADEPEEPQVALYQNFGPVALQQVVNELSLLLVEHQHPVS